MLNNVPDLNKQRKSQSTTKPAGLNKRTNVNWKVKMNNVDIKENIQKNVLIVVFFKDTYVFGYWWLD